MEQRLRSRNYDPPVERFARHSGKAATRIGNLIGRLMGEPPLPAYDGAPAVCNYNGPMPELDKNVRVLVQISEQGLESISTK